MPLLQPPNVSWTGGGRAAAASGAREDAFRSIPAAAAADAVVLLAAVAKTLPLPWGSGEGSTAATTAEQKRGRSVAYMGNDQESMCRGWKYGPKGEGGEDGRKGGARVQYISEVEKKYRITFETASSTSLRGTNH